jgi:hypothetical protein
MYYKLFIHSVQSSIRNVRFDVNFFLKLISILSIIYFCFIAYYTGYNFNGLLHIYRPKLDPVSSLNSILIYIFCVGILFLYYFQKSCSTDIIPYLHLPIKRNVIIYYVLVQSIFNFFNLFLLLFIVPFSLNSLLPTFGMGGIILYLTKIVSALIIVSYLALLLKNLLKISSLFGFIPIVLLLFIFILHGLVGVQLKSISYKVFSAHSEGDYLIILILIISILGLIISNFFLLKRSFYTIDSEEVTLLLTTKDSNRSLFDSKYIWYGLLEFKLISRNKRLKVFFVSTIGFILLFYNIIQNNQHNLFFSFIMYVLISGMFGYIFSQYLFSWESSYFEFILSTKFDLMRLLKTKYMIYIILGILVFLFFLPLIIQKKIDLHLFLTAILYNFSVGYFIVFYMATFNQARIELNGNVFFNYQGYNAMQFISIFIILFFPYLVLLLLTSVLNLTLSLFVINILCLGSFLNRKIWFKIILEHLNNRKYINMEGYRK